MKKPFLYFRIEAHSQQGYILPIVMVFLILTTLLIEALFENAQATHELSKQEQIEAQKETSLSIEANRLLRETAYLNQQGIHASAEGIEFRGTTQDQGQKIHVWQIHTQTFEGRVDCLSEGRCHMRSFYWKHD